MNKISIYTVVTGHFDDVKQPLVKDSRFDYILFTDVPIASDTGVWQVRPILYQHENARQRSRYPKIHPELVLSDYSASLYIDGNIQITSQWVYDRCVELFEQGIEWASIKHQWRNNVFEEMDWMIKAKWVHDYDVLSWCRFLHKEGYAYQNFMFENNIIFRRHTENVKKVNDIWWWSVENYVKRDQFSLMYALWKVPEIKTGFFLPETENAWNNGGHFQYTSHNPHKRILPWSLWETVRHRCFRAAYGDDAPYTILLDKVCKYNRPVSMMHVWTIYALFRYGYKVVIAMIKCRLPKKA